MTSQKICIHLYQGNYKREIPNNKVGLGIPKEPTEMLHERNNELKYLPEPDRPRPTHDSISEVRILCPSFFFLPMLQLLRLRNQIGKSEEKQKSWARKEEAPLPTAGRRPTLAKLEGREGGGTLPLSKDWNLYYFSGLDINYWTKLLCDQKWLKDLSLSEVIIWPGFHLRGGWVSFNVHCETAYVTLMQSFQPHA